MSFARAHPLPQPSTSFSKAARANLEYYEKGDTTPPSRIPVPNSNSRRYSSGRTSSRSRPPSASSSVLNSSTDQTPSRLKRPSVVSPHLKGSQEQFDAWRSQRHAQFEGGQIRSNLEAAAELYADTDTTTDFSRASDAAAALDDSHFETASITSKLRHNSEFEGSQVSMLLEGYKHTHSSSSALGRQSVFACPVVPYPPPARPPLQCLCPSKLYILFIPFHR
jgi:hypothetical protein